MIDFHTHILPNVDDGSRDVEESVQLLKMLSEQGVKTVIATPHFYADHEKTIDAFLLRRKRALESLGQVLDENAPEIICGAEVRYYPGISRLNEIKKLCIGDSRLLLLEMPMSSWSEYTVRELLELANTGRVTVVLAHIERYMGFQKKETMRRLYESGILMQVNAGFFIGFSTKRKAIGMLADGEIHFIGSDCHNISSRPPKIGQAFEIISKKLGEGLLSRVNEFGYRQLNK